MKTRFGNFLPDTLHSGFDNGFFRISPREARTLDPQMRVLMRVGLQAAEAAGLVVEEFTMNGSKAPEGVLRSEDVGCFVGVATNDYPFNLRNDIGVHYATGRFTPAFIPVHIKRFYMKVLFLLSWPDALHTLYTFRALLSCSTLRALRRPLLFTMLAGLCSRVIARLHWLAVLTSFQALT
jgi:hypothetical protein